MSKSIQISIAVLIVIAGMVFAITQKQAKPQNQALTMSLKDYFLKNFENELPEINSRLPHTIDQNTVLLSIEYKDNKVVSRYQMPQYQEKKDSGQKLAKEWIPRLQKQACLDETKKSLIDFDVDLLNRYEDAKGSVIFEFIVNKSICSAIQASAVVA